MATERSKHQRRTKTDEKEFLPLTNDQVFIFNYFFSAEKQLLKGRYRRKRNKKHFHFGIWVKKFKNIADNF